MKAKYTANWGVQIVGMIFQTRSNVLECNCVTGTYSIMLKVAFPSTMELDTFIGHLQQFGNTQTQIVFSTAVPPRGVGIETDETDTAEEIKKA